MRMNLHITVQQPEDLPLEWLMHTHADAPCVSLRVGGVNYVVTDPAWLRDVAAAADAAASSLEGVQ